jgi:ketosteroid isomerase-like protein
VSKEPAAPDLVRLTRDQHDAVSRHDIDAVMGFFAPDPVWDLSDAGMGIFQGAAAIAGFLEEWWETWGDHTIEAQEIVDLGHGVVFVDLCEDGRLLGSDGHVQQRRGWVYVWEREQIASQSGYLDPAAARAAAERLAESRAFSQER